MKKIFCFLLIFILIFCCFKISSSDESLNMVNNISEENDIQQVSQILESNSETTIDNTEDLPIYEEIRLVAAGDNLIHKNIINSGKQSDGTYNYNYMYDNIQDYLKQFDIRVINQETVLINDSSKYSGYPTFGSPIEIGDAVISAGFNVVTQATNHAYDKGEEGILDSMQYWNSKNIPVLGIHDNENDDVYILKTENTKIAMLNYTYGLNGFSLPSGKSYLVDTLSNKQKLLSDLEYAKNNADITIVFPHWGTEYLTEETDSQREWAQFFADNGADLIIGTHPHVVESLKIVTSKNGKEVPVFYSLGNLISNQNDIATIIGAFAEVTIINDNGNVFIKDYQMTPVVTHNDSSSNIFQVYLLNDYTDELVDKNKKLKNINLEDLYEFWSNY